jgi:hypothetical protein
VREEYFRVRSAAWGMFMRLWKKYYPMLHTRMIYEDMMDRCMLFGDGEPQDPESFQGLSAYIGIARRFINESKNQRRAKRSL